MIRGARCIKMSGKKVNEITQLIFLTLLIIILMLSENVTATDMSTMTKGCCYDTDEGLCSPVSERTTCEAETNGAWYSDPYCNVDGGLCTKICCAIGIENMWVTKRTCEKQSELLGIAYEIKSSVTSESACIQTEKDTKNGACVYDVGDESTCVFTSLPECSSIKGRFYEGKLCSNEELNTSCKRQDRIACLDGKDGIYWFDSCGNPENIYSSDKDASWNNGMVLTPKESCNPNSDNSESDSCGNCDYNRGSICRESEGGDTEMKDGFYTCHSLNCKGAPKLVTQMGIVTLRADKKNGESWCVYDGPIGGMLFGMDTVGSRHYRYVCSNGEVQVEPCADYRKEICVEKFYGAGELIGQSEAMCRVNMWEQCISANGGGGMGAVSDLIGGGGGQDSCQAGCMAQCMMNPDCRLHTVWVDNGFYFFTCVPLYKPGFESQGPMSIVEDVGSFVIDQTDFGDELSKLGELGSIGGDLLGGGGSSADEVCGLATKTCASTWVKMCPGGWTCKKNCNCHTASFSMQMNNLCVSLGDCGSYVNLMGSPTIGGAWVSPIKPKHGMAPIQPAILGIAYMAVTFVPSIIPASGGIFSEVPDILNLGGGMGGLSGLIDPFASELGLGSDVLSDFSPEGIDTNMFGRASGFNYFGVGMLFGCGKIEAVKIKFTCSPSSPTVGVCALCDGGPLKPCSKYKCESLGMNCGLINENTGSDECVLLNFPGKLPTITPLETATNRSLYKYTEITNGGFKIRERGGECINAFSPVPFGIETDVHAICRYDFENTDFENMSFAFSPGSFSKNHTSTMLLPSVESLVYSAVEDVNGTMDDYRTIYNNVSEEFRNLLGDLNIYVKCKNLEENANSNSYKINLCVKQGPDETPPEIMSIFPRTGSSAKYGATEQEVVLFVNEPVECRWGTKNPDLGTPLANYNTLENSMICSSTLVEESSMFYYPCKATLPINDTENNFYFLCKDQPWEDDDELRNVGAGAGAGYNYRLTRSDSKLKIESISPSGKILAGTEPVSVDLEVITSGGSYNGVSTCGFEVNNFNPINHSYIRFANTGDSYAHLQPSLQLMKGEHKIGIQCIDEAENIVTNGTLIKLELDTIPPTVTRVFRKGGSLTILTNENSECFYNLKTCNFNILSGEKMTTALTTSHSVNWNPESTYFIKCQDVWGNTNEGCSIVVRPSDL